MPDDLPTREDYFNIGAAEIIARAEARGRDTRVSRRAVFTEGTDVNILNAACSAMAAEATRHLAFRMAALYLDSAEGEDLDRLVADRFSPSLARKQAASSVVTLEFSRTDTATGATVPSGTTVATAGGVQFTTTTGAGFPIGSNGPLTVAAICTVTGDTGNVEADTINTVVTPAPGIPDLTVTNPEAASGGSGVESDEALRNRARRFFTTARRGTLEAIEFGALTVPGVATANAVELTSGGEPNGLVQLYVADESGRGNARLGELVEAELDEYRAAGVPVQVLSVAPVYVAISYSLSFAVGVDQVQAIENLKNLTVETLAELAPSAILERSLLYSLARSIPGAVVSDGAVINPVGDVVPGVAQTIRTTFDRVTINGV